MTYIQNYVDHFDKTHHLWHQLFSNYIKKYKIKILASSHYNFLQNKLVLYPKYVYTSSSIEFHQSLGFPIQLFCQIGEFKYFQTGKGINLQAKQGWKCVAKKIGLFVNKNYKYLIFLSSVFLIDILGIHFSHKLFFNKNIYSIMYVQ